MGHDAFYLLDVISSTDGEKITCMTYFGKCKESLIRHAEHADWLMRHVY